MVLNENIVTRYNYLGKSLDLFGQVSGALAQIVILAMPVTGKMVKTLYVKKVGDKR